MAERCISGSVSLLIDASGVPELPMNGEEMEGKIAIFIDGSHFEFIRTGAKYTWKFNDEVDYLKLLDEFSRDGILLRAYYYAGEWTDRSIAERVRYMENTGIPHYKIQKEEESLKRLQQGQAAFWRYLSRSGFFIRTKPVKVFYTGDQKADLDLELAIDMLTLADHCDRFVLISGDSDFVPLLKAVGLRGVRLIVAATQELSNPRAADELLDVADSFIELKNIWNRIERTD